ncbi:hypothetical protein M422DRAFT_60734 [Sphaerobolus stellatus SS14]|uniref:Uncharacterized protein n=1 Tax=Sphaerobolus stellatus (strain SS14) TaxID=990650 RepID=A0A0C9U7Y8_SPHS4|nr:hypothetical protein M422DRAFT_60734 [Sphaerobolus stellatus SS14]
MPMIALIYIINYIYRTAVTAARLKGMEADLGLSDIQYDTIIAILYVSYCPMQIPSNMVTQNYANILLCRVFIGLLEELAFRSAPFYRDLLISNAFGSVSIQIYRLILPDHVRLAEAAGEANQDAATDSKSLGLSFVNFFPTPPWLFATIPCALNALHANRTGERFSHIAGWWWAFIVGYIISLATMAVGGRYFSMFLMASGYVAVAIGPVKGSGNIRNLAKGSQYPQSMIITLCALALSSLLSLVIRQILMRDNRELDRQDMLVPTGSVEGSTFEEALKRKKGFRYLY